MRPECGLNRWTVGVRHIGRSDSSAITPRANRRRFRWQPPPTPSVAALRPRAHSPTCPKTPPGPIPPPLPLPNLPPSPLFPSMRTEFRHPLDRLPSHRLQNILQNRATTHATTTTPVPLSSIPSPPTALEYTLRCNPTARVQTEPLYYFGVTWEIEREGERETIE